MISGLIQNLRDSICSKYILVMVLIITWKLICRYKLSLRSCQKSAVLSAMTRISNYLILTWSDYFALWHMCPETRKRLLCWHVDFCKSQPQRSLHPPRPLFHQHMVGSLLRESPGYESAQTKTDICKIIVHFL